MYMRIAYNVHIHTAVLLHLHMHTSPSLLLYIVLCTVGTAASFCDIFGVSQTTKLVMLQERHIWANVMVFDIVPATLSEISFLAEYPI